MWALSFFIFPMIKTFANKSVDLSYPHVMGVLNITPDSFYDGGQFVREGRIDMDAALTRVELMAAAGATFVDIGGESTRPGAEQVGLQAEMDRVLPVVEAVINNLDIVVSVDTSSPELMSEAIRMGAGLINDVRALQRDGAVDVLSKCEVPVCLMHMQGMPQNMQSDPNYENVVSEVSRFLTERIDACEAAGIERTRLLVDPGFGFGKTDDHNIVLLQNLAEFKALGPVLVGLSRKSMIGRLLNRNVEDRLAGSLALAMLAAERGASIVRVHDVQETVDVLKLMQVVAKR